MIHQRAFTRTDLAVGILILLALLFLGFPSLVRFKRDQERIGCASRLKNIGLAFRVFATDHSDHFPMQVSTNQGGTAEFNYTTELFRHFAVFSNELSTPRILVCPSDSRRKSAYNFLGDISNSNLSYFLVPDAMETQTFLLAGDRNIISDSTRTNGILFVRSNNVLKWSSDMHNSLGNVIVGDGSVQYVYNTNMLFLLQRVVTPFRIALPE
jgi:competence protein ComGC